MSSPARSSDGPPALTQPAANLSCSRERGDLGKFLPNPKLKFLEQCREVMRFKRFSRRTEEAYLHWIKRFIVFHRRPTPDPSQEGNKPEGWRHPRDMGATE